MLKWYKARAWFMVGDLWGFWFWGGFLSGLQEVKELNSSCLFPFHGESLLIFACYTRHFPTIKWSLNFALLLGETSGTTLKLGNGKMFYLSLFDKSVFLMFLDAKTHARNKKMGDGASPFFPL